MDEDKTSYSAAIATTVRRDGGYCEIPEEPGLGIGLVEDYAELAPVGDRPFSDEGLLRADGSVASAF